MALLKIAFDVDDTIYKIDKDSFGNPCQVPDYEIITVLHWFHAQGHKIFVWSAGGVDYAQTIVNKLGLGNIVTVVPKKGWNDGDSPDMDISFDDMNVELAKVNVQVKREIREEL